MRSDRDEDLLTDIVSAARSALAFVEGLKYQDFAADLKAQSAVIYQLVIVGEAARGLSEDAYARFSEIPWPDTRCS